MPVKEFDLVCKLSGGRGQLAWQHAQLFRQHKDDDPDAFPLIVQIDFEEASTQ